METEVQLLVVAGVFIWILLCMIIGSFGQNRTIGFWGTFFASFFLSPLIAMLFVLASERKPQKGNGKSFKIGMATVLSIIILIPIYLSMEQDAYSEWRKDESKEFIFFSENRFQKKKLEDEIFRLKLETYSTIIDSYDGKSSEKIKETLNKAKESVNY